MKKSKQSIWLLLCFILLNTTQNVSAQMAIAKIGTMPVGGADGVAVWIHPDDYDARKLVDIAKMKDNDNVEGLAIYYAGKEKGYLIASLQGSWKYRVYSREESNEYIGAFGVITADGNGFIESHDCIEVTNVGLSLEFPDGIMVAQNANNACGRHFQLVPWPSIAKLFGLTVNSKYRPYSIVPKIKQN